MTKGVSAVQISEWIQDEKMKKVAIVTGATSGIGKAVVEVLLKRKINVIALGRSIEKINKTKAEFSHLTKELRLDFVLGDLGDNKKTNQAAFDLIKLLNRDYDGKLDILINVAGIVNSGYKENEDGNEVTFAVNHLSVFLLTRCLTLSLEKADKPRVLVVSSLSHYRATINWNNIQSKRFYNIMKAYKMSKLYNVLFVKEFVRRYKKIKIYAIDPGLVNTELGLKRTGRLAHFIWNMKRKNGVSPLVPARYIVEVATKNRYLDQSGEYIKQGIVVESSKGSYCKEDAKKLWDYSNKLVKITSSETVS